MPATGDIAATWIGPRRVYQRLLADDGGGEGQVLGWLMVGLLLVFVARLPELARMAHLSGGQTPFAALALGTGLGTMIFAPLAFYLLAVFGWVAARLFGARLTGWQARAVLFWALLATAPAMLLRGLVAGFLGAGPVLTLVNGIIGLAFLVFWATGLRTAVAVTADRTG